MKSRELLQESHHLRNIVRRQTTEEGLGYMIRVNASIDCMRFLLCQGLASRGHDESDTSHNQGNFLELLKYTTEYNDSIKSEVLKKSPGNNKLTSPDMQKYIGDSLFAVMVDESRDVSVREQMAVCIRYVNKEGCIIERFIGIIHVLETTTISLKNSVDALLSKYGLNIMRLRVQCYDGASNMQEMLEIVRREGTSEARGKSYDFLILMPTFDFVFTLFLTPFSVMCFLVTNFLSWLESVGLPRKWLRPKDIVYPHVYLLITLSLIFSVATATVERVFSAKKIVKNRLRSRIGDEYMNNCMLTYIEREIFRSISTDKIRKGFRLMAPRRGYC
ncbi:uncharacterized protein LOC113329110 [Papaver somniferum]|uniref:uncharacterized protein LOC113329110 n=1 Tax=Papaver somniferum TaxID=3469 RepID=UPI000E6FCB13|nr:uncharacterized protein LOC113329110 [Papaver somniferum]